jgi:hypothetical protein
MDAEFVVQFLILGGLGRVEGESAVETLRRAITAGHIDPVDGDLLARSALVQGALLHGLRIADERAFNPDQAPEGLKRLLVNLAERTAGLSMPNGDEPGHQSIPADVEAETSFDALAAHLVDLQARTRAAFEKVLSRG